MGGKECLVNCGGQICLERERERGGGRDTLSIEKEIRDKYEDGFW